jgi:hypothetical protein
VSCPQRSRSLRLTPLLFSPYSLVMTEYGFVTYEDGLYQERVHHIQLAYASYAALLALFEITSLLGVGMRGRR